MRSRAAGPRLLVPETVQTSGMDCGPAALRSLMAGFGLEVSYGRLREACQTDVDGTSINALEASARALGLDVAQLMLPADHVAIPCATALPAIAVARLPSGMPHFVVAWRRHGRWVQLMDPATGRRLVGARGVPDYLYIHEQPVPMAAWEGFAAAPTFQDALRERLRELRLREAEATALIERAQVAGPEAMAALDAQARVLAGGERSRAPREALERAVDDPAAALATLPPEAWFARPLDGGEEVLLRGAVLVRARGLADEPPDPATLTEDLAAALTEPPPQPARSLLAAARAAGRVAIAPLLVAIVLLAGGAVAEAALLRGSLDDDGAVRSTLLAVAGLALLLAVVETLTAAAGLGIGRRLEVGLRRALGRKLPRLPDRYLRSRPPSDLAERAHVLHELRVLPLLATQLLAAALETVLVAIALCVLAPAVAPLVLLATVGALGAAAVVQLPLRERELRAREHLSAVGQTNLDAVLGVLAIRAHGAEAAIAAQHEERLRGWIASARAAVRARTAAAFLQTACGIGLAIPVVVAGLDHLDGAPERLLLVLWAITIPVAAERVGQIALQWPGLRTLALRLAEPLDAPEAARSADAGSSPDGAGVTGGVEIVFDGATVRATAREVLTATTLRIAPGEHVALVGTSGAGKSTLMTLALGLADPSEGRVTVDGRPLDGGGATALWPHVAWVEPQVRIWNRDLAGNIAPGAVRPRVDALVRAAELDGVAARVADQPLGADGGLLSGGEGQRVRLARALAREGVRLAVLDEPLRGLDRGQRRRLLATARARWRDATLLCATHDVGEALGFDRILVLADGRVVADGTPEELLAAPDAPLRAMLEAEAALRDELDAGRGWRRLRVSDGALREEEAAVDDSGDDVEEGCGESDAPGETHSPHPPPATAPVDRAAPACAVFAGATILRYAAFAASWSVIGTAIFGGGGAGLTTWALLLAATIPLAALAEAAEGRTAIALGAQLRRRTLRGALALDPSWVRREGPGRIIGRAMEVDAIAHLAAGGGLGAVTLAIELGVAAVALAASAPGRAAAIPLAAVLVAASVTSAVAVRRRRAWTTARLSQTDELLEAIAGQRTRLVQGDDDAESRARRLDDYARLGARADRPFALLAGALPRLALAGGLAGIALAGDLDRPGDIALALGGVLLASQALRQLAVAVETLTSAALARQALEPILRAERAIAIAAPRTPPPRQAARRAATADGALRVRGLSVRRGDRTVLHDVDLVLQPGDRAVLTGASGAGKSTLATALAGILPASHGHVGLDGARPGDPGWRDRVGLVPQHGDNHVLLAPVAFNLLMGRGWPASEAALAEAAEVCTELGLGPVLQRMPAGLGQTVGETGWRLSQGERARLCLARALLADHDVLILDEPLGALDPQTARTVLAVARRRARTLVVISQE